MEIPIIKTPEQILLEAAQEKEDTRKYDRRYDK